MAEEQKPPYVIELNVGGTNITTSLSTLTKYPDSMLAAMFSGRQPLSTDRKGRYFVDCDGDIFKLILEYLRFRSLPPASSALKVYEYAKYFCLQDLIDALNIYQDVRVFYIGTIMKETLQKNGDLAIYEKIKYDILSYYVTKTDFLLAVSYNATPSQKSCEHYVGQNFYNYVDAFSYYFNREGPSEWLKGMQFDLENNGFKGKLNVHNQKYNCLHCNVSANIIVHKCEPIDC